MRRLSLFATVVLASTGAHAAEYEFVQAVCVHNAGFVNNLVMVQAQAAVTAVFDRARVRIEWLSSKLCRAAGESVLLLEMDPVVPAKFGPETMAYAMPYAAVGTSIHIFCDRVMQDHRAQAGQVLGYVIAHEIGHVLERIARHSSAGLMKSHWDASDYYRMSKYNLLFAAEDVELMHLHLQRLAALNLSARFKR